VIDELGEACANNSQHKGGYGKGGLKAPTWLLGGPCQAIIARQAVDDGGLAYVGPPYDGILGQRIWRAVCNFPAAFQELRFLDTAIVW
jgi:hypothetical protein